MPSNVNGSAIGLDTTITRYGIARTLQKEHFDKVAGADQVVSRQDLVNTFDTVPPFSSARSAALSLLANDAAFQAFDIADGKLDGHFSAESLQKVLDTVYSDLPEAELAKSLGSYFSNLAHEGSFSYADLEGVLASNVYNEVKSVAATLKANPKLFERIAGSDGRIDWNDFRAFSQSLHG